MSAEDDLVSALEALGNQHTYQSMQDLVRGFLDRLTERGKLQLGPDHQLGGNALETRVRLLIAQIGWTGSTTQVDADLVLSIPPGFKPARPLVFEIKSGKGVAPDRSHLRQLDDWVFDLSGEERARKRNVVAAPAGMRGQLSPTLARVHPNPHKGVFIYNGPLGTPFEQRPRDWLGANEITFAEKRNFCVLRLETLLAWVATCTDDNACREFWKKIQETAGVLSMP